MIWLFKFLTFLFYYVAVTTFLIYLHVNNAINFLELNVFSSSASATKPSYDIIIVGGGTAGLTIAAGLKEKNVLIIEAGADFQSPNAQISSSIGRIIHNIPMATPLLQFHELFDWQYKTQPQKEACKSLTNNASHWPTGKGFGGTQLINNMIYERGHRDDFRDWFNAEPGTYNFKSYVEDILPFYEEFEAFLELSYLQSTTKAANAFIQAKEQLDDPNILEFKFPEVIQNNGKRWSVVNSYHLYPNAKKYRVLSDARAERILFDGDAADTKTALKAVGVRYRKLGNLYEVRATKAVIIAGGTVGTPTLLLKSGIGPENLYAQTTNKTAKKDNRSTVDDPLKLKLQKHLPAVGQNLQDHVTTGIDLITLNQSLGLEPWNLYSIKHLCDYFWNGEGPFTMGGCEGLGFVRTNLDDLYARDLGFMLIPMGATLDAGVYFRRLFNINERTWKEYFQPLIATPTISLLPIVLHPKSRGSVSIRLNRDDDVETIIDPQYLTHQYDVDVLVAGLKLIQKIVKTPAFQALGASITPKLLPGCNQFRFTSDEYWQCYAKHLTLTAYHPVGTCRMGFNQSDSVVHPTTFQVHGVDQLYICDASIMPSLPSSNPQATVGMLARKFLHSFYAQQSSHNSEDSL